MIIRSFPPLIGRDAKILILGTVPGERSLRLQQYYGHGGNHFWKLLFDIVSVPYSTSYASRKALIQQNGIALWDVLKACRREGSSDSAIVDEAPNDFAELEARLSTLEKICFNGKKAYAYFLRYVDAFQGLPKSVLPSTSGANASTTYKEKLRIWRAEIARPQLYKHAGRIASEER